MAVTLKSIAKETGVSETVVSHVLNNRKSTVRVSEVKREMILTTAKRMGYVPNLRARAMATGKNCTIAVLHTDPYDVNNPMSQGYVFQVLRAVEDVCRSEEYHCLYATVRSNREEKMSLPRVLLDGSVDGVILMDHTSDADAREILSLGIPCVHFGSNIAADLAVDCVYCDLDKGFADSVSHLYQLGHRHIQMLFPSGPGPELHAQGFLAMEKIYPDLRAEVRLLDSVSAGRKEAQAYAIEELAARSDSPTAFIAPNEIWQGFVDGMARLGRACPANYSLVALMSTAGVDDSWLRIYPGNIKLSHISNPVGKVGAQAARLLLAKLGVLTLDSEEARQNVIPCDLVIAESCGPCQGRDSSVADRSKDRGGRAMKSLSV
jgi:LacI family transcriptional regulator